VIAEREQDFPEPEARRAGERSAMRTVTFFRLCSGPVDDELFGLARGGSLYRGERRSIADRAAADLGRQRFGGGGVWQTPVSSSAGAVVRGRGAEAVETFNSTMEYFGP
jgi:hypothetical protein